MFTRRRLTQVAVVVLLAGGTFLVFGSSEERRVLEALREIAAAASSQRGDTRLSRQRRIAATFRKRVSDSAVLVVPELGAVEGRSASSELFAQAHDVGLEVSIEESDVHIEGRRARATLLVEVRFRPTGEERVERRDVVVDLERAGDEYQVVRVDVGPASREEPEARP